MLRNLKGLGFEEVARRMRRSPGGVRVLWLRALEQLRRLRSVPGQALGRRTMGCEGTHGVFPRCDLACTPVPMTARTSASGRASARVARADVAAVRNAVIHVPSRSASGVPVSGSNATITA